MKGAALYGPKDIRFERRDDPKIIQPTEAILRLAETCVCGSDLGPYRGLHQVAEGYRAMDDVARSKRC
jgi:threonine dehydrogenase-like Zn-dependent dehydrogenase